MRASLRCCVQPACAGTRRGSTAATRPRRCSRQPVPCRAQAAGLGGGPDGAAGAPNVRITCSVEEAELPLRHSGMPPAPAHLRLITSFQVQYLHDCRLYGIFGLPTQKHADQVADLLSLKAAVDARQPLDRLQLRSRAEPLRADELAEQVYSELAARSFRELFHEVEGWTEGLRGYRKLFREVKLERFDSEARPTLLLQAVEYGSTLGAQLVLLLDPAAASAANTPISGHSPLSAAAARGSEALVRLLLQAAPHMARLPDATGRCPIHTAAACGNLPALRLLLQATPETAGAAFSSLQEVADSHSVARAGGQLSVPSGLDSVQQLLPGGGLGSLSLVGGCMPLHLAARYKACPEAVELLLQAAPGSAMQMDGKGQLPLHRAASAGNTPALRLLLAAAPGAALVRSDNPGVVSRIVGRLRASPRDLARSLGLQEPAWAARWAGDLTPTPTPDYGLTPLHLAAWEGHAEAVSLLLEQAPAAAQLQDAEGRTLLQLALAGMADPSQSSRHHVQDSDHTGAARLLLAAASVAAAAAELQTAGPAAWPLFGDLVAARLPLAEAEWALLPAPCPGLLPALPAALACSLEQARQLVRRLGLVDKQRLRSAALKLGQERQRDVRTQLPSAAAQQLLFEGLQG